MEWNETDCKQSMTNEIHLSIIYLHGYSDGLEKAEIKRAGGLFRDQTNTFTKMNR